VNDSVHNLCKILISHSGVAEEMSLVECYAVSLGEWGEWFLMF